jgi:mono/diheme cytochrome c family protein
MSGKIKLIIFALFLFPAFQLFSQDWTVPADQSSIQNPQDYNLKNVKSGKNVYMLNCKSCHGDPGKFNALPLVPLPPDITDEKMQANSEGDLFFKITNGRGAMPQFETVLSEDDRWRIVNFIMNYNPGRTAILIESPAIKAKIWASVDEENEAIEVIIEVENKDGSFTTLANVPVIFSIKKIFGHLPIGTGITKEDGRLVFAVPETLVGDDQGLANIVVSLNEDYEAKAFELDNAKLATPNHPTGLIKPGVIWSTNDNMPKWLIICFVGLVGGAWLTIGYVVLQIVKIKKLSKE